MTEKERREQLKKSLQEREEYRQFLDWVDNYSPDSFMTFEQWQQAKEAAEHDNYFWTDEPA